MESQLWVDKHRPKSSSELAGNNTLVATIRGWLNQWQAVHLKGREPTSFPGERGGWGGTQGNLNPSPAGRGKPKDLQPLPLPLSPATCKPLPKPQPSTGSGSGKPKDLHKKAILLSGPPGIGKTSAAHIIAR